MPLSWFCFVSAREKVSKVSNWCKSETKHIQVEVLIGQRRMRWWVLYEKENNKINLNNNSICRKNKDPLFRCHFDSSSIILSAKWGLQMNCETFVCVLHLITNLLTRIPNQFAFVIKSPCKSIFFLFCVIFCSWNSWWARRKN